VSDFSIDQDRDDQDLAEGFDSDKLSEDTDDPAGELEFPPERPLGVNQYGTTAAEEHVGEPADERARRDTRDPLDAIAEPDDEELRRIELDEADLEADLEELAELESDDDDEDDSSGARVGRLVDPSAEDDAVDAEDDEPEAIARSADEYERDLSAEEDAVHLTPDPPFLPLGDGYVDEDGEVESEL
jgi:hypothetical protein